jgi:predicted Fe-Mo cluster-binding NifX family protein
MDKIAITSEGPSLDDQVDPRFGRAAGFLLVDLDTMDTQYIENGQSQVMAQGAGIQAAQTICRAGVDWVLTGFVGPKAFRVLEAAGIRVGQNLDGLTVREAVARFQGGGIVQAAAANRTGQ